MDSDLKHEMESDPIGWVKRNIDALIGNGMSPVTAVRLLLEDDEEVIVKILLNEVK